MKLLIDFGNSYVKWASLDQAGSMQIGAAIDHRGYSGDEKLPHIIAGLPIHLCREINAVSVLGENFNSAFSHVVLSEFSIQSKFYYSQKNAFDVELAYDDPITYGADRYAALIAAAHTEVGAKIIVDIGTAVTIDAINADNVHLGGVIFPGLESMYSALNKADGIGVVASQNSIKYLNKTTQSAVYSGSALCLRHGVEGIVSEISHMFDENVIVLVAGGGAESVLKENIENYVLRRDLVLLGVEIMQRN